MGQALDDSGSRYSIMAGGIVCIGCISMFFAVFNGKSSRVKAADGFLKWFNGPDCQQVGKGISLHGVETIKSFDVEEEYSFVVVAQGRNVTLMTNSESERPRWILGLTLQTKVVNKRELSWLQPHQPLPYLQIDLLHGGTSQGPPSRCHHKTPGMRILKPSVNSTNTSEEVELRTSTLSSLNSSNQYNERRWKGGESQKERIKLKNEHASERGSKKCTVELRACHQPCTTAKTFVIKVAPAQMPETERKEPL